MRERTVEGDRMPPIPAIKSAGESSKGPVIVLGVGLDGAADGAVGTVFFIGGRCLVSVVNERNHVEARLVISRHMRDEGIGSPEDVRGVQNGRDVLRFNVGFDGPDKRFIFENGPDSAEAGRVREAFRVLGAGDSAVVFSPHRFKRRYDDY